MFPPSNRCRKTWCFLCFISIWGSHINVFFFHYLKRHITRNKPTHKWILKSVMMWVTMWLYVFIYICNTRVILVIGNTRSPHIIYHITSYHIQSFQVLYWVKWKEKKTASGIEVGSLHYISEMVTSDLITVYTFKYY